VPEKPRCAGNAPTQERNHQRRPASRADERRDGEDERRKRDYEAPPLGILRALVVRLLLVLGLPAPLAPAQQARALRARAAIGGGRASVETLLRRNGHARTLRTRHVGARHHFTVVTHERHGHFCARVGQPPPPPPPPPGFVSTLLVNKCLKCTQSPVCGPTVCRIDSYGGHGDAFAGDALPAAHAR